MREERNRANARLPIWCLENVPSAEEEIIKRRSGSGKGLRSWRQSTPRDISQQTDKGSAERGLVPLGRRGRLAFVAAQDSLLLFGSSTPFEH